jgi:hypothetical protein
MITMVAFFAVAILSSLLSEGKGAKKELAAMETTSKG